MAGANSNIQITDLDFNNIKNNLKNFLKSQDTLKDYNYEGSALSVLLDVLSYNTQYNAFYTNMVANEMFLDSAIQRSSVVSHAKLLNYTPRSATCPEASVTLVITGVNDTGTLTIPKHTRFISEAIDGINYQFVTPDSYSTTINSIVKTASFVDIKLKQGIPVNFDYVVDSANNPKFMFKIPNVNVDTSTLVVQVQTSVSDSSFEVYTLSTDYLSLNQNSKVYFLQEGMDGFYEIQFGDGVLGKKLIDGNIVKLSYLVTSGSAAYKANSFVLMDNVGSYSNYTLTTLSSATAGSEKESIQSIKFQAPKSHAAQNRAVTKEDYITLLQQNKIGLSFDSVNVWGGEENNPPVYGQVFICAKPSGAYSITESQKNRLMDEVISPASVMTVQPIFTNPDYTYLQLTVDILYDPKKTNLSSGQLQSAVKEKLIAYSGQTLNTFNSTFSVTDFNAVIKYTDNSIITSDLKVKVQKKIFPNLTTPTSYNLQFGVPLERGIFQSGITSSPAIQYRSTYNKSVIVDGIYIEEIPAPSGGIDSIIITNPGFNYQFAPTVTILGDGAGATAVAEINSIGRLKSITVTNAGSGYTSSIIKITPLSQDTTGQQAAAAAVLQGRYGNLRTYYNDSTSVKSIFDSTVGVVDYQDGIISLQAFNPIQVDNDLGQLTITAKPTTTIISSTYNRIITVDPYDPNSIIVNVIAKT